DVAVIGATNRPDLIDPALLRSGRFETHIELGLPDVTARRAMLDITDVPFADDVDLDELAEMTEGLSFADLEGMLREAALTALRRDTSAREVTLTDLMQARERFLSARHELDDRGEVAQRPLLDHRVVETPSPAPLAQVGGDLLGGACQEVLRGGRQGLDGRGAVAQRLLLDLRVVEAPSPATVDQAGGDLLGGARREVRRGEDGLGLGAVRLGQLLGTPAAIAHLGSEDEDVQLETGEPLPGHLPDPLDLGVDQLARAGEAVSQLLAVGDLPGGDADDVGVAG